MLPEELSERFEDLREEVSSLLEDSEYDVICLATYDGSRRLYYTPEDKVYFETGAWPSYKIEATPENILKYRQEETMGNEDITLQEAVEEAVDYLENAREKLSEEK